MPTIRSVSSADKRSLSIAAARAAQPTSVISVESRLSVVRLDSTPIGGVRAPAGGGGGGATRAAMLLSPIWLRAKLRNTSSGRAHKPGTSAISPVSLRPQLGSASFLAAWHLGPKPQRVPRHLRRRRACRVRGKSGPAARPRPAPLPAAARRWG